MYDFSRPLGDAVKKARAEAGLTQSQLAEKLGIDYRSILNIENYKANPEMKLLYPLLRVLGIDSREIFNPGAKRERPAQFQLRSLVDECSEEEASALIPILLAILKALREDRPKKRKQHT